MHYNLSAHPHIHTLINHIAQLQKRRCAKIGVCQPGWTCSAPECSKNWPNAFALQHPGAPPVHATNTQFVLMMLLLLRSAASRVWGKLLTNNSGMLKAPPARAPIPFPAFRSARAGQSRRVLTGTELFDVARAINRSAIAIETKTVVLSSDLHSLATLYTCAMEAGGMVRFPSALDRTKAAGRGGQNHMRGCFLVGYRGCGFREAVLGQVLWFVKVLYKSPERHKGFPVDFIYANVFRAEPAEDPSTSFGFTVVDTDRPLSVFIESAFVGAPVGLVRSPRVMQPRNLKWIVETHWSSKHRHHIHQK